MIKPACEMEKISKRNENYEKGYKKAVESVVKSIDKASKEGYRRTCFHPSVYWYENEIGIESFIDFYDEVKEEFKNHGYKFEPTGYVGGVWQRAEDICW